MPGRGEVPFATLARVTSRARKWNLFSWLPLGIAGIALGVIGVAQADDADLRIEVVRALVDARGAVDRDTEHSCSQSFASTHTHAEASLHVETGGVARLTIDILSRGTFGPSPYRFREGEQNVNYTGQRARAVFSGTSAIADAELAVRFTRLEYASIEWRGAGSLDVPAATTMEVATTLRCRIVPVSVFPAETRADETSVSLPLASCTFDPMRLANFDLGILVFGRGEGVRSIMRQTMSGYDEPLVIRRAR